MHSYDQMDSSSITPDLNIIGNIYQHYKNQKLYIVTGIGFDSERDEWTVDHYCLDDENKKLGQVKPSQARRIIYHRSLTNFFGLVNHTDTLRFELKTKGCKVITG